MSGYTCEVPIPAMFQRLVDKPKYLRHLLNDQVTEAGCVEVPACMRYICIREEDPLVDFRVVSLLLGEEPQSLFDIADLNRLSPHTTTFDNLRALILDMDGLPVWKHGAATGTTRGLMVALHGDTEQDNQLRGMADHLNPPMGITQATPGSSDIVFLGKIRWQTAGDPFADGGDSGSLVWSELNGVKLPIGLHVGSGDGYSTCLLIQSIFDIIEEIYDKDYFFCGMGYCGRKS